MDESSTTAPTGGNLLTTSRLTTRRRCAREHHLTYELGYRPAETDEPLRLGSLVHAGLEAWWRDEAWLAALDVAARREGERDEYLVARAEIMLRAYGARWSADRERYDVLGVEVPFEAELPNPATGRSSRTWRIAGKLDAIVRERSTGRVLLVEHKTTSEDVAPGADYWRRLRMDAQVSHYFLGAQSLGHDVAGCIYDVLRKPALRPLLATPPEARKYTKAGALYANQRETDETPAEFSTRLAEAYAAEPEKYFARGEVVRLDGEIADHLADVWQIGRSIREDQLAGRYPRNVDACVRYGRTCAFFRVCSGEGSLDDRSLYRIATASHEELQPKSEG